MFSTCHVANIASEYVFYDHVTKGDLINILYEIVNNNVVLSVNTSRLKAALPIIHES